MVTMLATVVRTWGTSQVLVTDNANGQQVLVNTGYNTGNLVQGDQVRIGRSRYETELLRLTDKSIYDILRTKMTGGIGYEK